MFEFQKDCGLKLIKDLVEGDKNLSRIYGFILYTEQDPYVVKALRDEDFWNALNSKSGDNWPIFAARPLQQGRTRFSGGGGPGQMSMMIATWDEPKANLPVIRDFGLEDSQDLPLFVAFMWDDEDNLNEITIPIRGDNVDEVYHSLEKIVRTITRTEERILPEYKGTVNVFRNVKAELEALKLKHTVISRGKMIGRLAGFLSMFY